MVSRKEDNYLYDSGYGSTVGNYLQHTSCFSEVALLLSEYITLNIFFLIPRAIGQQNVLSCSDLHDDTESPASW